MTQNDDKLFEEYIRTGNIEVRNIIVEKYYYMAKVLAGKFLNRGVDYDDLLQVASLALVKAAERFKFKPRVVDGVALSTRGVQNLFSFRLDDL